MSVVTVVIETDSEVLERVMDDLVFWYCNHYPPPYGIFFSLCKSDFLRWFFPSIQIHIDPKQNRVKLIFETHNNNLLYKKFKEIIEQVSKEIEAL